MVVFSVSLCKAVDARAMHVNRAATRRADQSHDSCFDLFLVQTLLPRCAETGMANNWNCSLVRRIREDAAAQHIQRAARVWLARRLVQRLREEELSSRAVRSVAALNIQVGDMNHTHLARQVP